MTTPAPYAMEGTAGVQRFHKGFQPSPPDFTVYSLSPARAFGVITNGYPGTAMSPFGSLTADVRWGLVERINDKRTK